MSSKDDEKEWDPEREKKRDAFLDRVMGIFDTHGDTFLKVLEGGLEMRPPSARAVALPPGRTMFPPPDPAAHIEVRKISNGFMMSFFKAVKVVTALGIPFDAYGPKRIDACFQTPDQGAIILAEAMKSAELLEEAANKLADYYASHGGDSFLASSLDPSSPPPA